MAGAAGSAHGALAGLFASQSSAYAAFRPRYPPQLFQAVLRFAGLEEAQQRGLAVDLGCGSGQASADLAALFRRVVGIDASAEQLAHADRSRANVEYRCGPVEATGLPPQSVDLITAATSLHWWAACSRLGARLSPVLARLRFMHAEPPCGAQAAACRPATAGFPSAPPAALPCTVQHCRACCNVACRAHGRLPRLMARRFDLPAVYRESRRILKPGGALAAWTYTASRCCMLPPEFARVQRHGGSSLCSPERLLGARLTKPPLPLPAALERAALRRCARFAGAPALNWAAALLLRPHASCCTLS